MRKKNYIRQKSLSSVPYPSCARGIIVLQRIVARVLIDYDVRACNGLRRCRSPGVVWTSWCRRKYNIIRNALRCVIACNIAACLCTVWCVCVYGFGECENRTKSAKKRRVRVKADALLLAVPLCDKGTDVACVRAPRFVYFAMVP